ncbi:Endoplasmic reticulum aminopeptidase 2 [Liparis tanakae]|uniref:Endoplasmic reticulum aminopeptidase 2 n=1 Tax=Liparis tanakae TaxID=230148 RepID=A0A4Z2F5B6_9TELE|nr:Endoplasmic reticulum aminopeptidase 2 [Liparis tanakae]
MVARNPRGRQLTWTVVRTNWDTLVQLFSESVRDQASQLRAARVTLDSVQNNVRWFQRNRETLRSWLSKQLK